MDGIYANLRALLRQWSRSARRPTRCLSSRRCLLHVEQLEERRVPTVTHTYVVTTTAYSTDTSHLSFNSNGDAYNTNGTPVSLFETLTAIDAVSPSTGQSLIPGPNVIDFDVAGSGVHVFALPAGTANPTEVIAQSNTTIKGYSQPGSSANTSTGTSDNAQIDVQFNFALDVTGSNTVIKGVALPALALGAGQGNQVSGDFVGVTPGGVSMSSSLTGVTVGTAGSASTNTTSHVTDDTVGTAAAGDRNVISGHLGTTGYGVALVGGSSDNSVQNNLIGTNLGGTAALSNAQAGVYFDASATSQNAITGNIIAFNHGDGIQMAGGSGTQFNGNSIFANAAGIVLAATANNGIVAPVFTHWNPTTVTGELTKFTAGATYTLDFYNNTQTDSAGHYEGQTPWAIVSVTPNSLGQFTASVTEPISGGLTATVTDAKGDTSAFSAPTDFNISAASAPTLSLVEGTPATNALIGIITRDGNPNPNISQLQAVVSWGDGTQATLTSQPSAAGQIVAGPYSTFVVRGSHTYAKAGTYHITATVTDRATDASNSGIDTTVQVADAPLTSTSVAIRPVALSPLHGEVATFTELNPSATATQFTATLNWGDGTTTTGTVTVGTTTANGTTYQVSGSHTYTAAGQYSVTVTIQDADGGTTETSHSTTVAPGPMTPDGTTISATEGTPFTGTVGSFTAAGAGANPQYTAVITWGNGQTTTASTAAGTIVVDPVPTPAFVTMYSVTGTNTYAAHGTYPVAIVVTGPGSETTTIDSIADVADAALSSTSVAINPELGAAFNGVVATFTEQNPSATASQFTASINWGDGTTTIGTVTTSGTTFNVSGSHAYATANQYLVTVTIRDADGGTTTTSLSTTVAAIAFTPDAITINPTEGTPFTGPIGSFTAANAGSNASYTAVITWGNGQTTTASTAAGTIVGLPGLAGSATGSPAPVTAYYITGTNTYGAAGTYPVSIAVTGPGFATTTIDSTADVTEESFFSTSVAIYPTAGAAFNGVVWTFGEQYYGATASQFTATINWGDGTTTTGSVTAYGARFDVNGSHTYTAAGQYLVTVTINDAVGGTITGSSSTTVAPVASTPGATTIGANPGTPFTGTVGSFTVADASAIAQYTAVITWGNGQTTTASTATGTIVPASQGAVVGSPVPPTEYSITGTNTYAAVGTYPVSIVVTGPGSATTTINSTAEVADAPPSDVFVLLAPVVQTPYQGIVANFYGNPTATAGQFTATINWGDGTTTTGTVIAETSVYSSVAEFDVDGSHTYATAGVYTVNVTITDRNGGTTTSATNITLTTPSSLVSNNGPAITATAGTPFTGVIGSFVDTNPSDDNAATLFTAMILWGDGTGGSASTAAGTIQYAGNGEFLIYGTDTYAAYDTSASFYAQINVTGVTSLAPTTVIDTYVNLTPI